MILLGELPVEIILVIISQLDKPNDLLSFALTNHTLCSLIIPDGLDYCRLDCNVYSFGAWQILGQNPGLCIHCKDLTISTVKTPNLTRSNVIPKVVRDDEASEDHGAYEEPSSYLTRRQLSAQYMNKAISSMRNLSRLSLRIRGNWWKDRTNFEDLSKALLKSRCILSQLIVLLTGAKTDRIGLAMILQPNLLMSLSKFSLSDLVFSFDRREEEVYVDIIASLSQAQNLTHLCLKLNAVLPTVGYIIVNRGYWPKLRHLSLPGFAISSPSSSNDGQNQVQLFLERHINLRTLILPTYLFHSGTITETGRALSNLQALELDNVQNHTVHLLDQIPARILGNLSHLTITTGSRLLPGLGLSITTMVILRRLPQLRSCILYYNEEDGRNFVIRAVEFLANGSPFLEKLWMRVHDVNPPVEVVLPLLKGLRCLTHLMGFFWTTCISDGLLRQLDDLVSPEKDLYIDAMPTSNQNHDFLRLFRDSKSDRLGYDIIPRSKARCLHLDCDSWGGFYQGV